MARRLAELKHRGSVTAAVRIGILGLVAATLNSSASAQNSIPVYKAAALLHAQALVARDIGKVVALDAHAFAWDSASANGYGAGYDANNKNLVYDEKPFNGGQIIVRMNCTGCYADTNRLWLVILRGIMPGTTLPLVQFLRYADSGKGADTVRQQITSPGGGEPPKKPDDPESKRLQHNKIHVEDDGTEVGDAIALIKRDYTPKRNDLYQSMQASWVSEVKRILPDGRQIVSVRFTESKADSPSEWVVEISNVDRKTYKLVSTNRQALIDFAKNR